MTLRKVWVKSDPLHQQLLFKPNSILSIFFTHNDMLTLSKTALTLALCCPRCLHILPVIFTKCLATSLFPFLEGIS